MHGRVLVRLSVNDCVASYTRPGRDNNEAIRARRRSNHAPLASAHHLEYSRSVYIREKNGELANLRYSAVHESFPNRESQRRRQKSTL